MKVCCILNCVSFYTDFRTHPIGVTWLKDKHSAVSSCNVGVYYCLQTKLQEGDVFMSVCHSVHRLMHPEEDSFHMESTPPPPKTDSQ